MLPRLKVSDNTGTSGGTLVKHHASHRVRSLQHVRPGSDPQGFIAARSAFEDFAGDVPTSPMLLGPG